MNILSEVETQHNSMYVLRRDVNKACLHAQPAGHTESKPEELRVSMTCRAASRLKVNSKLSKHKTRMSERPRFKQKNCPTGYTGGCGDSLG